MWVLSHGPPPLPLPWVWHPMGWPQSRSVRPVSQLPHPDSGTCISGGGPVAAGGGPRLVLCWGLSLYGGVSGRFSLGGWRLLQHLRAVCPCDSVSEEWFPRGGFVTATASQTIRRGGTLTGLRLAPGPPVPVSLDNYNPPTPPWPRRVQERRRGGQARVPIPAGCEGGELMGTLSLCRAVTLGGLSPSVSGTEGLLFAKEREQLT